VEKPSASSRGNVRLDARRRSPSRSRSPRRDRERDLDVRRPDHHAFDSKPSRMGSRRSHSLSRSPGRKSKPIPRYIFVKKKNSHIITVGKTLPARKHILLVFGLGGQV